MSPRELREFQQLLRIWRQEDFGSLDNFSAGLWSRRNLDAMIDDVTKVIELDRQIARSTAP